MADERVLVLFAIGVLGDEVLGALRKASAWADLAGATIRTPGAGSQIPENGERLSRLVPCPVC